MARLRETALYYEPDAGSHTFAEPDAEHNPSAEPMADQSDQSASQPANKSANLSANPSADTAARIRGVKSTLVRLGIQIRNVAATESGQVIGSLLGRKNFPPCETDSPATAPPISEPVLLLDGLTSKRLDILLRELRKSGVTLPCKAVVTDNNIHWSFAKLYRELVAEREALAQAAAAAKAESQCPIGIATPAEVKAALANLEADPE